LTPYNGLANRSPENASNVHDDTSDADEKRLGALLGALAAEIAPADADLSALLTAWATLPEAIKAGIVAMVKASKGGKP
jgi:hypothetical protein